MHLSYPHDYKKITTKKRGKTAPSPTALGSFTNTSLLATQSKHLHLKCHTGRMIISVAFAHTERHRCASKRMFRTQFKQQKLAEVKTSGKTEMLNRGTKPQSALSFGKRKWFISCSAIHICKAKLHWTTETLIKYLFESPPLCLLQSEGIPYIKS